MDLQTVSNSIAVVCDRAGEQAAAMRAFLESRGVEDAAWYAPRDVDDVDRAVRSGAMRRVIFPGTRNLFDAIWDEEISFEQWLKAGASVDFVEKPAGDAAACVAAMFTSWQHWRRVHRRRQTIAGVVLSMVAIAAAFAVLAA
jgi:hypothetical protein